MAAGIDCNAPPLLCHDPYTAALMPASRRAALPVVTVAFLIAACSAGDPDAASSTTSPAPSTSPPTTSGATTTTSPLDPTLPLHFAEVSEEAGIDVVRDTPVEAKDVGTIMVGGAAAGDFDGDGWTDVFVIGSNSGPDRLYHNNGDGTFTDVAEPAGVARLHRGSGVTTGDYDGDGDLDLFVTSLGVEVPEAGHHMLYRNEGDGSFIEVAAQAGLTTTSTDQPDGTGSAFGDYDLDGDLDLFVAGWWRDSQGNRLFRNEGDGTFTDVTRTAEIDASGARGFSPCWVDTTRDRYPELMLVSDFGTTHYFLNDGDGTFTEAAAASGAGLEWSGMGTAIGDVDGDGLVDWLATAIFDEVEGRGDGNKLYLGRNDGSFVESTEDLGVADGGWGWGALMVDADLDGRTDIIEANGWWIPQYVDEPGRVWLAGDDGTFTDVAAGAGLTMAAQALTVLDLDFDRDGDLDFLFTSPVDHVHLYRTDLAEGRSWLRVRLDTSGRDDLAPDGIGSRITVRIGGSAQTQWITGCSNFLSGREYVAHFGLGDATLVNRIRVDWADGTATLVDGVAADQEIVVEAPSRD